jgi:hypothetical protein
VPKEPAIHNIDVSIRTIVMNAARTRVQAIRREEKATTGVPTTTMASVSREILTSWQPEQTRAVGETQGSPVDSAGNRLTKRGHRKYTKSDTDAVPAFDWVTGTHRQRAEQLLAHLRKISDPARGTTLGPIAAVRKAATEEKLLDVEVDGKPFLKHLSAAERAVLKPLRFTLPENVYAMIAARLNEHECTITRALEVGLETFARTGKINPKG